MLENLLRFTKLALPYYVLHYCYVVGHCLNGTHLSPWSSCMKYCGFLWSYQSCVLTFDVGTTFYCVALIQLVNLLHGLMHRRFTSIFEMPQLPPIFSIIYWGKWFLDCFLLVWFPRKNMVSNFFVIFWKLFEFGI